MKKEERCAPPHNFHPAGRVYTAAFAPSPPLFIASQRRRNTGRRAAGVRYEVKGQAWLAAKYPDNYIAAPWLNFHNGQPRVCQPDGLLVDAKRGRITIVEFKLRHTSDAWFQVRELYEPVVRAIFPWRGWQFPALEIVCWFDPHVPFPEHYHFTHDPMWVRCAEFGIHLWKGK